MTEALASGRFRSPTSTRPSRAAPAWPAALDAAASVGPGEREYLYCDRCGAARSLPPEDLDPVRDQIRRLHGFEARFTHFPIVGLCGSCAADPGASWESPDTY